MEPRKDPRPPYDVERSARHAERPGFRISEVQIRPIPKVPWHYQTNIRDTFSVFEGRICVSLRDPEEEIRLPPGETYTVRERRPHLVTNSGEGSASFQVFQGFGEYDFIPLT